MGSLFVVCVLQAPDLLIAAFRHMQVVWRSRSSGVPCRAAKQRDAGRRMIPLLGMQSAQCLLVTCAEVGVHTLDMHKQTENEKLSVWMHVVGA